MGECIIPGENTVYRMFQDHPLLLQFKGGPGLFGLEVGDVLVEPVGEIVRCVGLRRRFGPKQPAGGGLGVAVGELVEGFCKLQQGLWAMSREV